MSFFFRKLGFLLLAEALRRTGQEKEELEAASYSAFFQPLSYGLSGLQRAWSSNEAQPTCLGDGSTPIPGPLGTPRDLHQTLSITEPEKRNHHGECSWSAGRITLGELQAALCCGH